MRNVPWEMGDIIPDYVLGPTTCALFLRYESKKDLIVCLFVTIFYSVFINKLDLQSGLTH